MDRVLEPELMEEHQQVQAYAEADFSEPHNHFVERITEFIGPDFSGRALDLGCGSGDISFRFARRYPQCKIDALDGSKAMLDYGVSNLPTTLAKQINFVHTRLPLQTTLPISYDIIFSNSLLHHLPDPQVLWQTIKICAKAKTSVMVMDLLRPDSKSQAKFLVQEYAANEPEILRHDFYHSLLAAHTLDEIKTQLIATQLDFSVEQISDRHVLITGKIKAST